MRIGTVIGKVTLNRSHPSYASAKLRLVLPLELADVARAAAEPEPPRPADADLLVVWDELGAGEGSLIAIAEGPEASQPFRPAKKPVDAYAAALIDGLRIDTGVIEGMLPGSDPKSARKRRTR